MITISIKISRDALDQIIYYSKKYNMTRSEFIRRAISSYIINMRNKELAAENPKQLRVKVVPITICRKREPKPKPKIRITAREMMIKRELPPPKVKFLRVET